MEGYRGSINLDTRKVLVNEDGSISTESSFSFSPDGKNEILIPSIVEGKRVTQAQAIKHFYRTKEHLGVFQLDTNTHEQIDTYAKKLHERQAQVYMKRQQLKNKLKPIPKKD